MPDTLNLPLPNRRQRPLTLTAEQVALTLREVADPGLPPEWEPATDADFEALRDGILEAQEGPLWIFAYGSLIWRPGFEFDRVRHGTAPGWHRSFCLEIRQWRGSEEVPGLMMGLERGGSCTGLLMEVAPGREREELMALLRREMVAKQHLGEVRRVSVRPREADLPETVAAITFYAGTNGPSVVSLPPEEQAWRLAHACGHGGSGAEYLRNTVEILGQYGLHDRNLWRLQELVSREIDRWDGRPPLLPGPALTEPRG